MTSRFTKWVGRQTTLVVGDETYDGTVQIAPCSNGHGRATNEYYFKTNEGREVRIDRERIVSTGSPKGLILQINSDSINPFKQIH